jgi:lambda repressor-like predicted transcriptional regulator
MYRFGQRQTDPRRKKPGCRDSGRVAVTPDKYHALISNHCPGYISEEQFRRNQERIRHNRFGKSSKGSVRNGASLLAGILYCAKCGRQMTVAYSSGVMRYYCTTGRIDFRAPPCQSLSGRTLDELVTDRLLRALEPAALEISILAANDLEAEHRRVDDNWQQRLERNRFETERTRRQYQAVEPENRLVARELERQWETALQHLQSLEQEYARHRGTSFTTLSEQHKSEIRSLANNLPALWRAASTTNADRQRIVRLLVERVEVNVQGTTEQVDVSLRWSGGFTSQHELTRPVRRYNQTADFARLKARLVELKRAGRSYAEIATELNQEGFRPSKQTNLFNQAIVGRLAKNFCRELTETRDRAPTELQTHEWTVIGLARELGIPRSTLHSWKQRGWLRAHRQLPGYRGQLIYWADAGELGRLRQLRQAKWNFGDPPLPKTLTTPITKPASEC